MTAIITAGVGSAIAAIVSLITLYQNRKWQKEDKRDSTLEMIQSVKDMLTGYISTNEEREAKQCRTRILRFNDELLCGTMHSKEAFDMMLEDITWYENYCSSHPGFQNGIATMAISNIRRVYTKCMEEHTFL